ncbi:MAG: ShlB/FhaC/HecB family hemolysin secretion/activation protein [Betaproteobacteria bacterium]|nr:ShlB/FhaC/HecB family hemolysin secretion/activation protein [Betaproteobacteria bacterium]
MTFVAAAGAQDNDAATSEPLHLRLGMTIVAAAGTPGNEVVPNEPLQLQPALTLMAAAEAQDAKVPAAPRFDIERFVVEGSTYFSAEELDRIVAPYAGKQRDFADVQRALEALQKAYFDRGLTAVQVLLPEQELEQGVIRFRVIEATIGKVAIEGAEFFTDANIRNSLPALQEGRPPNSKRIGENLRLANESPAKRTAIILKSTDKEEVIDATLKVTDEKHWKSGLTLDNTGTAATGTYRVGLSYRHANMFDRDHIMSLQYLTSPEKSENVAVLGFGYRIPLYALGDHFEIFLGRSDVDSGTVETAGAPFQISGSGTVLGLRYNQLLGKVHESYDQRLVYGWDWRDYKPVVVQPGQNVNLLSDVTVRPFSLTYLGQWRFTTSDLGFYLSGAQNIAFGNDGTRADIDAARKFGRGDYFIFRYGFNFNKAFENDWLFRFSYSAQDTRDALVPGEQFGLGGAESVRGFLEREIASDKGKLVKFEVYSPDMAQKLGIKNTRLRLLAFGDAGEVVRNNVQGSEIPWEGVSSLGIGLRLSYGSHVSLRLDLAQVQNGGGTQHRGDGRAHFGLLVVY